MTSEYRPRQHPLMNPEAAAAVLRQLVAGWDGDDQDAFVRALVEARRLLGASAPRQEPETSVADSLRSLLTDERGEKQPIGRLLWIVKLCVERLDLASAPRQEPEHDDLAMLQTIRDEFRKAADECLDVAMQIERRFDTQLEFGGDRATAAHYRKNLQHYEVRCFALDAAIAALRASAPRQEPDADVTTEYKATTVTRTPLSKDYRDTVAANIEAGRAATMERKKAPICRDVYGRSQDASPEARLEALSVPAGPLIHAGAAGPTGRALCGAVSMTGPDVTVTCAPCLERLRAGHFAALDPSAAARLLIEDEAELNRLAALSPAPPTCRAAPTPTGKFRDRLMHAASAWHEGVLDQWALLHQFDLVIDDIATSAAPAPTDRQE